MSIGTILINIIAAALIILVIWWFFGGNVKTIAAADVPVTILVKDGVYQPAFIQIPANKQITLHFMREDDSACSSTVIFPQLKVSYVLPKNKSVTITLPPQPAGMIDFTCQMGMYRGKIVVE
ncbi:MAG TPA: cupredoxin domain-containing protein [Gammaproteobacteria bacterium]|jgi:plastocyanin domain-containing protein|nr:cupredoxin domain-containing protein [Gammaproteobacteria bacterium]